MRARWLKPEYYRDRKVAQLGIVTALVFPALWLVADDGGVFRADPVLIKGEMFALWDDVPTSAIESALDALERTGRIHRYRVDDEDYAEITHFAKHQGKIHKASKFRHPRPNVSLHHSGTTPGDSGTASEMSGTSDPTPHHLYTHIPQHPDTHTPAADAGGAGAVATEDEQPRAPRTAYPPEFDRFWAVYPKRDGDSNKAGALRAWNARIREGVAPAYLIDRAGVYARFCDAKGRTGTDTVMMASTFLGRDRRFEDEFTIPSHATPALTRTPNGATAEPSREWLQQNGYPVSSLREVA